MNNNPNFGRYNIKIEGGKLVNKNGDDHNQSDIDKVIKKLNLEEIKKDSDDVELEFDEITYEDDDIQDQMDDYGDKNPKNKFDKIMNILLTVGGAIIVVLLVIIIIGKSSADDNLATADSTSETFTEEETTTIEIDRVTDLQKATTGTTTKEPTTQKPVQTTTQAAISTQADISVSKTTAISQLNAYANGFNQSNYTEVNWGAFQTALANGIVSINAAKTENEVASALGSAKAALANIPTGTPIVEEPESGNVEP